MSSLLSSSSNATALASLRTWSEMRRESADLLRIRDLVRRNGVSPASIDQRLNVVCQRCLHETRGALDGRGFHQVLDNELASRCALGAYRDAPAQSDGLDQLRNRGGIRQFKIG